MKKLLNFRYGYKTINGRIYSKTLLQKMFEESLNKKLTFIPVVPSVHDIVNDIIVPYTKLIACGNNFEFGKNGEIFIDIEIIDPLYEKIIESSYLGLFSIGGVNNHMVENATIIALYIDYNNSGIETIVQPKIDIYK